MGRAAGGAGGVAGATAASVPGGGRLPGPDRRRATASGGDTPTVRGRLARRRGSPAPPGRSGRGRPPARGVPATPAADVPAPAPDRRGPRRT
ncbi:hypothetical protein RZS08_12960, partial [Arthrospira platensis SPKY1]|nr:hypothetical protein [Arthrospira platensis SPKY1]